jgi:peptidyl-prolyl cis-trans isomerase B (cyclophilin B)
MIQGGGFTPDLVQKKTKDPIKNEADNGLKNEEGTLAMARLGQALGNIPAADTASAEFFINVANNAFLNHKNKTEAGWGYAVFGKVSSGMDIVNKIKAVKVANKMGTIDGQKAPLEKVPLEPVVIKSIRLKEK